MAEASAPAPRDAATGLDPTASAYRLQQLPGAPHAPGYIEQFAGGAKHALDRAALGLEGAVKGAANYIPGVNWEMDPENVQNVKRGEAFVKQTGPASTVGQIAGDVGLSLAPVAGAAGKATQLARALRMGKWAPLAGDVAANAGYSALTAPEDRGTAAAFGGGGAAAGRVVARTLGGAVRPTTQAQELMDQGVRMTPGQAGEGVMGQAAKLYEDALGAVPILGRPVKAAQREGLEDWNRQVLLKAGKSPQAIEDVGSVSINRGAPIGQKGIDLLKKQYDDAYAELFPKGAVLKLTDDGAKTLNQDIARLSIELPPSLQGKFDELTTGIAFRLKNGMQAQHWKETVTGDLTAAQKAAITNGDNSLARALNAFEKKLLDRMESGHIQNAPNPQALADVDSGYKQFKVLQKAGQRAAAIKRGGTLYPAEVAVDSAKRGDSRLLRQALEAQEMFGNAPSELSKLGNIAKATAVGAVGHGVAGGAAVPVALTSLLGTTEMGRKFLLGQIPWQAFTQAHPDIAAQVGRALAQQGQPQPGGQ
jgi:hypothetical protein